MKARNCVKSLHPFAILPLAAIACFTLAVNTHADVVHADDTIVQGGFCAGSADCVDGETFSNNVGDIDIHIKSASPQVFLEDTDSSAVDFALQADSDELGIYVDSPLKQIIGIRSSANSDAITIDGGSIGLFTSTPSSGAELVVGNTSGSITDIELATSTDRWSIKAIDELFAISNTLPDTKFLVENTDETAPSPQFMYELRNESNAKVRFAITSNAANNINTWTFDNNPFANHFSISKLGTGLNEFIVEATGDGIFRRDVYAADFLVTSSRSLKTDFAEVDTLDILDRVVSLPITQWRYKTEDETQRHVGPVAEDFRAAFQLSDGETISAIDASGVALAAIQGLKREKDSEMERLAAENAALASDNAALRSQLQEQDGRIVQLEMALTELLKEKDSELQVGASR